MTCSTCGSDVEAVVFEIPTAYREYVSTGEQTATICPHCLTVGPASEPADSSDGGADGNGRSPDFTRMSDAFPTGEGAVPFALALGLCSSLALNREAIGTLLEHVERAGTDPLLAIDRLLEEPSIDPEVDLAGRRHQLEQLLY